MLCIQEGDYSWGDEGEETTAGGHIRERDGSLVLEGYIADRQVTANVAAVDNSLHIFTQVYTAYWHMHLRVKY